MKVPLAPPRLNDELPVLVVFLAVPFVVVAVALLLLLLSLPLLSLSTRFERRPMLPVFARRLVSLQLKTNDSVPSVKKPASLVQEHCRSLLVVALMEQRLLCLHWFVVRQRLGRHFLSARLNAENSNLLDQGS